MCLGISRLAIPPFASRKICKTPQPCLFHVVVQTDQVPSEEGEEKEREPREDEEELAAIGSSQNVELSPEGSARHRLRHSRLVVLTVRWTCAAALGILRHEHASLLNCVL